MPGGIIQLVANSDAPENMWINGDPQITFFKTVYRRHTPFAMELIPIRFNNELHFGNSGNANIPFYGDLVHRMFLVFEIPELMAVFTNSKIDDIKKIICQTCLADEELSKKLYFLISDSEPLDIDIIFLLVEEYLEKYETGKQENLNILENLNSEFIGMNTDFSDLKIILADKWISKKINHYPIFQLLKLIHRIEKPIINKTPLLNGKYIFNKIINKNILLRTNSNNIDEQNIFIDFYGHELEILFMHQMKYSKIADCSINQSLKSSNLLDSSSDPQSHQIADVFNEFKKNHQLENDSDFLNTYQLAKHSLDQNINLYNIFYDFGPCFYNVLNTYNTLIYILRGLATTIPIITTKSFSLANDYDIYNDTINIKINTNYNATVIDTDYMNNFLIEEFNTEYKVMDFGVTENLIFPGHFGNSYANLYNNEARKMMNIIRQSMDILFEKYRNNLFSFTNKLFFNNNNTNNNIYAYVIPTKPYITQNCMIETRNVFNTNIWFFHFFKYLDLFNESNFASHVQNNSNINMTNNDLLFVKYLIILLKINISYYMNEISYLLNDLYSKTPSNSSPNTMKNYVPYTSFAMNNQTTCNPDQQSKLLFITHIFHRNHVPTILEIFQFIYHFIDTISIDKINAVLDTNIINSSQTSRLRSIIKLFYYQIFKFFMDVYDSFRFEAPAKFSTNEFGTDDNLLVSQYVTHFLRGNVLFAGHQISISKIVPQMEFYFTTEMLHMRQLQNFYDTIFDKNLILKNVGATTAGLIDTINNYFIKKDNNWSNPIIYETDTIRKYWDNTYQHNILNNIPDNLYYATFNTDRYNGQSYLYTPYQSRDYDMISTIPLLSPIPLPPTNPYGINPLYYDHKPNEMYVKNNNLVNNFTNLEGNYSSHNDTTKSFKLYKIDYFRIKHDIFKNSKNSKFPFDNYHWNILHFFRLIKHLNQIYPNYDNYLLYWLESLAHYSINFTDLISGSDIGTLNTFIQQINHSLTKELILDVEKIATSMFNELFDPSVNFPPYSEYSDNIIDIIVSLRDNFMFQYFNYCRNVDLIKSIEEICKRTVFDNSEKILEKMVDNKIISDIPSIFFRDPDSNPEYIEELLAVYDNSNYFNKNIFNDLMSIIVPNTFATKTFKDIIDSINVIFMAAIKIVDFCQTANKLEWLRSIFNDVYPLLIKKIELLEEIAVDYQNIINAGIFEDKDIQKIALVAHSKGLSYEKYYNYIETIIKPIFESNNSEEQRLQLLNQIGTDSDYFFLFEVFGTKIDPSYNFKKFVLDQILQSEPEILKSFEPINNEYLLFVHFLINYVWDNKLSTVSIKNPLIFYCDKNVITDQNNIHSYYNNFTYIVDVIIYLMDYLWDSTMVHDLYNLTPRHISSGINEIHLSTIQLNNEKNNNIIIENNKIEQILNNDSNRIRNIISALNNSTNSSKNQMINNLVRTITNNSNTTAQNYKINFLGERNHIIDFVKDVAKKEIVILEKCSKELMNMRERIADVLQRGKFARTAWVRKLAHFMIEKIYIRFGDDICDYQISDWFETYHQISKHDDQEVAYNKMIGNTDDLILFDNRIKKSCTLALPLIFYFNKHAASSIPINASINTKYDITVQLRKFEDLAYKEEFSDFIDPKLYNECKKIKCIRPEICNAYIMTEYVYLSIEERTIFVNNMLEYLSDEIQYDMIDIADNNLTPIYKILSIKKKKSLKNINRGTSCTRISRDKQSLLHQYSSSRHPSSVLSTIDKLEPIESKTNFNMDQNNSVFASNRKNKKENREENRNKHNEFYVNKYKLESLDYQPDFLAKNNYVLEEIIDRTGVPKLFMKNRSFILGDRHQDPFVHKKRVVINNNFNHPSKMMTILIKPKAHVDICFRNGCSNYFFGEKQWDNYGLYPYFDLSKIRQAKMDYYYQIRKNITNTKNYNLGPIRVLNEILDLDLKNPDLRELILVIKKYLTTEDKILCLSGSTVTLSKIDQCCLFNPNKIKFREDMLLLKIDYHILCPKIFTHIFCDVITKLEAPMNPKKISEIVNKIKFPITNQNEILLTINEYIKQHNDFFCLEIKSERIKNTIDFFYKKYNETIIEKIYRAAHIGNTYYHFDSIINSINQTETKEIAMGLKLIKQKNDFIKNETHVIKNLMCKKIIYSAIYHDTHQSIEEIYNNIIPYSLISNLATEMTCALNGLLNNNCYKYIDYQKILIKNPEVNPLLSGYLKFNGENIMPKNSVNIMWSEAQAYEYFNHSPSVGMNFHVWALQPLEYCPNGSCNLSRISDFKSVLDLHPTIGTVYPATITTIVLNMNIVRFMSGMNGKAWLARS